MDLMPLSQLKPKDLEYGRPTQASGKAMVSYILRAIDLALARQVAGMVTAPISKLSMNLSGYHYPGPHRAAGGEDRDPGGGHDAGRGGVPGGPGHHPLRPGRGARALEHEGLFRLFDLTCKALDRDFGLAGAPLAVAALNPHAGEGGMFGREEEEIIIPAIKEARAAGLAVDGPFPADTLFWRHRQGEFAAVVCMYHDQGLIPLKLLHFMDGVNVTLGLPIIRTSRGPRHRLRPGGHRPGATRRASRPPSRWRRRWRGDWGEEIWDKGIGSLPMVFPPSSIPQYFLDRFILLPYNLLRIYEIR